MAEAWKKLQDFHHPPALDEDIQPALKKIYDDLTFDDLLSRCLGANTQNNNESFNSTVWHLAPKHIFSGRKIVELATNIAVCTFNEGDEPFLKMIETMGVTIGAGATAIAKQNDERRVHRANKRSSEATKERRTQMRAERSRENELYEDAEGILYGAGIAD